MSNHRFYRKKRTWLKKILPTHSEPKRADYILVGLIFFILIFGLAALSSASSVVSFRDYGNTYPLFFRQFRNRLIPGLILFFILARINYQHWLRYTVFFFVLAILLLLAVFVPGLGTSYDTGARSWLNLGGISFQPAETIKLLLILSLAGWFGQRPKEMNQNFWNGLVPFVAILAIISLLIILQPDYGSLFVILTIALSIYFVAGAAWRHLFGLIFAGLGLFGLLIAQAPYRAARLMTFLDPELDPEGIGYHINQAFLAIGSGGWLGLGFGQSRQKFAYLPEVIGDSIFAVIAEEIGFIFSAALIVVFLVLFFRGMKLAQATQDEYARYLVVGIISWFTLQAFLNIGGMLGLMPLTGIPLPFVSYGGTALMSALAAAGILVNISRQVKL